MKYNNDKSRDYTNPNLPSGEGAQLPIETSALGLGPAGRHPPYSTVALFYQQWNYLLRVLLPVISGSQCWMDHCPYYI